MHKCIYETAPIHLSNEITRTIHTHDLTTRAASNGDVQVPESKCETFKQSFQYQGAILWNNLPSGLRNIADINEFKYFYKQINFWILGTAQWASCMSMSAICMYIWTVYVHVSIYLPTIVLMHMLYLCYRYVCAYMYNIPHAYMVNVLVWKWF